MEFLFRDFGFKKFRIAHFTIFKSRICRIFKFSNFGAFVFFFHFENLEFLGFGIPVSEFIFKNFRTRNFIIFKFRIAVLFRGISSGLLTILEITCLLIKLFNVCLFKFSIKFNTRLLYSRFSHDFLFFIIWINRNAVSNAVAPQRNRIECSISNK